MVNNLNMGSPKKKSNNRVSASADVTPVSIHKPSVALVDPDTHGVATVFGREYEHSPLPRSTTMTKGGLDARTTMVLVPSFGTWERIECLGF